MTDPASPPPSGGRGTLIGRLRPVALPLVAMMWVQVAISMAVITMPIIAVLAAPDIGVDVHYVGFFSAAAFVVCSFSAPVGGALVDRLGAGRVSQLSVLSSSIGIGLVATASLPVVLLGALLMGLGNGPATPASTNILSRRAPPGLLALVLSIKQSGGAIGNVLAGLVLPSLAIAIGWRGTTLAVAVFGIGLGVLLQFARANLDREVMTAKEKAARPSILSGMVEVHSRRPLAVLSICGFCFCVAQLAIMTFFVPYMVDRVGLTPVKAGWLYSIGLGVAVFARILIGGLSDWLGNRNRILFVLGFGQSVAVLWLALLEPDAATIELLAVAILFGCTGLTWTGVFLAELAQKVPIERMGAISGAVFTYFYVGCVVGPAIFATARDATANYDLGFILIGVPAFLSAIPFLLPRRIIT
ncbi:MAG: MFS transporter [Alphaproteobacteria bacterium]